MSAAPSGPMSLDVAMDWVSGRDTGLSSTAIWRHMMGLDPRDRTWGNEVCYPHDPDDFGRCYRLLARIPAWRGRIGEMAQYPVWRHLAAAWGELEALWEGEVGPGEAMKRGYFGKRADRLYARMRELIEMVPR